MNPTDIPTLLRELGTNAGLISFVVFAYAFLRGSEPLGAVEPSWQPRLRTASYGFAFGVGAGLSMLAPLSFGNGVFIDVRQAILALGGAFLAPPAALLAGVVAAVFRASRGGEGAVIGVALVVCSTLLGMLWRQHRHRWRLVHGRQAPIWNTLIWLATLGLAITAMSLAFGALLPALRQGRFVSHFIPTALLVYPATTVLFGLLLDGFERLHHRELALQKAAEVSEQAASVFRNSREAIVILDADGVILDANPGYCLMTGYARDELLGRNVSMMNSGLHDGTYIAAVAQRVREYGHWEGEMWRRRKSGELYLTSVAMDAVHGEDGQLKQLVVIASDLTEKRKHQEDLIRASSYDPLTGLPNRRLITQKLNAAITQCDQQGTLMAVCYLDMDDFRRINDTYSHQKGDELLVMLAARLREELGPQEELGRLGGDEFVIILSGLHHRQQALERIEHIRWRVSEPMAIDGRSESLCASVGVTIYPDDHSDGDALLRHADLSMYGAKELGKNQLHLFDAERDARQQTRRDTMVRISQALDAGEMELFFQPKVRLAHASVVGVESLVRWRHPERGLLAPGLFLDQILGTPVAQKLDHWVLRAAVAQSHAWLQDGLALAVSVNVTVSSLVESGFVEQVQALLDAYPGLPAHMLEIELLETETMNDLSLVSHVIEQLQNIGVRCSIDDFGTGYSSLSYLQRLPAQIIKIDQSFVREMLTNDQDRALVQGVIGLARAFGRTVVAEGVETNAHAQALDAMGCDVLQGYGIARPMPAGQVSAWVRAWEVPASFMLHGSHSG